MVGAAMGRARHATAEVQAAAPSFAPKPRKQRSQLTGQSREQAICLRPYRSVTLSIYAVPVKLFTPYTQRGAVPGGAGEPGVRVARTHVVREVEMPNTRSHGHCG